MSRYNTGNRQQFQQQTVTMIQTTTTTLFCHTLVLGSHWLGCRFLAGGLSLPVRSAVDG